MCIRDRGVNDAFGHDKGDEYIRAAADAIRDSFPRGQVFRIGGDEFAVILSGVSPQEVEEGVQVLRCTMEEYSSRCSFDASEMCIRDRIWIQEMR